MEMTAGRKSPFKTFKSFKSFKPSPSSSPASRGRNRGGGLNGAQRLNGWNGLNGARSALLFGFAAARVLFPVGRHRDRFGKHYDVIKAIGRGVTYNVLRVSAFLHRLDAV